MNNVGAAGGIEDVRSLEDMRERPAILAVAHEAQACGWRHGAGNAAQAAATATKRNVQEHRTVS